MGKEESTKLKKQLFVALPGLLHMGICLCSLVLVDKKNGSRQITPPESGRADITKGEHP